MLELQQPITETASAVQLLHACHTPDPDDGYAWWAITCGRLTIPGVRFEVSTQPIQQINEACQREELDVAAISSATYPLISSNYAILAAGASVGRGYGPALASLSLRSVAELRGRRVAVPGNQTTGALLLRLFFPGLEIIEMPFDAIAPALARGDIEAGVLIHEELLNWEVNGLRRLLCLGEEWQRRTGLPIPVGLNVVRRALGPRMMHSVLRAVRESMVEAEHSPDSASAHAMSFSMQARQGIGSKFIRMFANSDTLDLPEDCLQALRLLFEMAHSAGLTASVPPLDLVR